MPAHVITEEPTTEESVVSVSSASSKPPAAPPKSGGDAKKQTKAADSSATASVAKTSANKKSDPKVKSNAGTTATSGASGKRDVMALTVEENAILEASFEDASEEVSRLADRSILADTDDGAYFRKVLPWLERTRRDVCHI